MIERHIITGEYPPDEGGVGGHTAVLAAALVQCGERIHVWCPGTTGAYSNGDLTVHRELDDLGPADLRRIPAALSGSPCRLLVQWVPHAFGRRSLNLAFCAWLRRRAAAGDRVEVIVHEPFLPFRGGIRALAGAAVHRVMAMMLLRAATRVWVVTPAWTRFLRPYAPKRDLGFDWLPVPSTLPIVSHAVRPSGANDFLIGSFATGGLHTDDMLGTSLLPLMAKRAEIHLLLLGRGSEPLRASLIRREPSLGSRIAATGSMPRAALSERVLGCDAGLQPYADGVCGRRTSAMAFLAHARPLVTTDGDFTEDAWRHGSVALVPAAAAPERITQAVEHLVADAEARERLGRAGRVLYEARFDVRHAASALHKAVC